ncbi:MAG: MFS transporter [Bacteroidia bacterium]|nr:MFS transporter [Bacteroidia bacterium]
MSVTRNPFNAIVIIAALGYFVDIYDLILFGIVRTPSLKALGITQPDLLLTYGVNLISIQMIGMLVGGILWGVLGDKKGRVSVLFGSILMYSVANILNAYVAPCAQFLNIDIITCYSLLRFVAGIGLAGELGAGITLVNETMTKEHRGYGTMIVVSFGVLGAVFANLLAEFANNYYGIDEGWRVSYIVGGVMGLALLVMRIGVYESGMFADVKTANVQRGNLMMLFNNKQRFKKYLQCIGLGVPIWYVIGILVILSPEIGKELDIVGIDGGRAIMYFYAATCLGDFACAYFSQRFKSRKKVLCFFIVGCAILTPVYLYGLNQASLLAFYIMCGLLGFFTGFWAVFVTTSSEQFGTNIRATVTTTVPNMVRGSLALLTAILGLLRFQCHINFIHALFIVGIIAFAVSLISLNGLDETYAKDLNYHE